MERKCDEERRVVPDKNIIMDYIIIPFLVHLSSFWVCCAYFYRYDKKIIEKSNENENENKYYNAIKTSLINQFFISLPILYVFQDLIKTTTEQSESYSYIKNICNIFLIANISNLILFVRGSKVGIREPFKVVFT